MSINPTLQACPHVVCACNLVSFLSYDAVLILVTFLSVNEVSIPVHSTPGVVGQETCLSARLFDCVVMVQLIIQVVCLSGTVAKCPDGSSWFLV